MSYCTSACFCFWPDNNEFFKRGIIEGVLASNNNLLLTGYVFVDFSLANLPLYVDDRWHLFLSQANLKIILVSDRYIAPLANYWCKKQRNVSSVIYHNEGVAAAKEKIKKLFIGNVIFSPQGKIMTEAELDILSRLIQGMSLQQVAQETNMNIRNVYAYKQRIERHLGNKLNRLYANNGHYAA